LLSISVVLYATPIKTVNVHAHTIVKSHLLFVVVNLG